MYFTKMNYANGKNYKQHISGTEILKLALRYSYDTSGKLYFNRNAKWSSIHGSFS